MSWFPFGSHLYAIYYTRVRPKENYNGLSPWMDYIKNGEENGADEDYFWIGSREEHRRNREQN